MRWGYDSKRAVERREIWRYMGDGYGREKRRKIRVE